MRLKKLRIERSVALFLCICFFVVAKAQDNERLWSDGKLTWEDFKGQGKDPVGGKIAALYHDVSYLEFIISYKEVKKKHKDSTIMRLVAVCTVVQNKSWILPYYKTAQYLKYNQIIFDIAELYSRKLQFELDNIVSSHEAMYKLHGIYEECKKNIKEFRSATAGGQYIAIMDDWQRKIEDELSTIPASSVTPAYVKRNFGYGFHVGLGCGVFTGSLNEYFSPAYNILFGFDVAYKRAVLFLNATIAFSSVKSDYRQWVKGQAAHYALLDLSCGYAVIDNAKWKLTPFAGLGLSELSSQRTNNDANLRISYIDYNFIFGLNADYKFKKTISFIPDAFFRVRENVEYSVRGRLYIARANYYADLQGFSVNLAVEFSGFGNFIKLKK